MDNNFNGQNNLNNISPIEPVGQPLFVDVSTEQSPIPSTSETLSLDNQIIKVVEGVRSAYSEPQKPVKPTDPVEIQKEKDANALRRQTEYDKIMQRVKLEQDRKLAEEQKIIQDREKLEAARKVKEEESKKQMEADRLKREQEMLEIEQAKASGNAAMISGARKKEKQLTERQRLEYQAKADYLANQLKDSSQTSARLNTPIIFDYVAKNSKGEIEKSSVEALSRMDVYSFLQAEGFEIYEISASKTENGIRFDTYKMKISKLVFYLSQLSAYLKSGIALADSVKILTNQSTSSNDKKAWKAVYYDLSMGDNLSQALEKRKNTFPKLLINMVKTAEMTGNLVETLDDMVEYYSESESVKKEMKSALMYPMVISIFAIAVTIFMLVYIVPQFESMYADMGSELPGITKFIISMSDFLGNYLIWILLGIVLFVVLFIVLFKNVQPFRKTMQSLAMKLPVFGNIIIYSEVNVFAKTFSNLINHSVFITDSIDILGKITNNEVYKGLIYNAAQNLIKGESLSSAFEDQWAFPDIAYQMLITGEKTGRLGIMLEKVAAYFQEQHRNMINAMKSLIEPILIVFLALIVGGILLSVILPMFNMYSQIS